MQTRLPFGFYIKPLSRLSFFVLALTLGYAGAANADTWKPGDVMSYSKNLPLGDHASIDRAGEQFWYGVLIWFCADRRHLHDAVHELECRAGVLACSVAKRLRRL